MNYRQLSVPDIEILKKNGCVADDWSNVLVTDAFDAQRVKNAEFNGKIQIGSTKTMSGTAQKSYAIKNASLQNVSIGDNCHIINVHGRLSNLNIGNSVHIENVGEIACEGLSHFGNGTEIEVLNEAGGRELKISSETSAQIGYMSVLYRNDRKLMDKISAISDRYSDELKNDRITIGNGARIMNSKRIIDTLIGEYAVINGVSMLRNGTVDSSKEAPTFVENDVIAENFIFQKGASIKDGAMIQNSLIGEASRVGKQFSAENSILFANSEGFHSEICSVFGGPYTVTHHRSTLLIAGMFSFFNAGSGTNQSNHMYKLGPVHQGILERGCKTGSSSYLLWPCRVGAFTAIIGKHYANFDTSDLPFSYISEDSGKSVAVPAMNFFTAGTLRDGLKWPTRDRRKNSDKLDLMNFQVLSPYTVQKVVRGMDVLTKLAEGSEKGQEFVNHRGIRIKRLLLKTGKRYYQLILDKYFGDVLIKKIIAENPKDLFTLLNECEEGNQGPDEWLDICGLLCAKKRVTQIIEDIKSDSIKDINSLKLSFHKLHEAYDADEWRWFLAQYHEIHKMQLSDETPERIIGLLEKWKDSSLKLLNMVLQDAGKEFGGSVAIGYGIDGEADLDFESVRGSFETNSFVKTIRENIDELQSTYETMKKLIK